LFATFLGRAGSGRFVTITKRSASESHFIIIVKAKEEIGLAVKTSEKFLHSNMRGSGLRHRDVSDRLPIRAPHYDPQLWITADSDRAELKGPTAPRSIFNQVIYGVAQSLIRATASLITGRTVAMMMQGRCVKSRLLTMPSACPLQEWVNAKALAARSGKCVDLRRFLEGITGAPQRSLA